jgi:cation diffusion facilitator family transporter
LSRGGAGTEAQNRHPQRGESRRAIIASIAANVAIAITKFIVAAVARSTAMLAEGVHSLANCFDGALLLLGQSRARKPPDDDHPFGYGREEYFWSLIVAIVFFALGAGVAIYEGVRHELYPQPAGDPKWSYIVLAASALFDGASFVVGLKQFRREARGRGYWATVRHSKNPSLFSVVLEDTADLTGLALAFLGIFLGHALGLPWLDGAASIAIGLVIAAVAIVRLVETHGLIIGERASPELMAAVRARAEQEPGVRRVAGISSLHVGPSEIVVVLELEFIPEATAADVHRGVAAISTDLRREHADVSRVLFEAVAETRD